MSEKTMLREGAPEEAGMDPKRMQRARDMLHAHVDQGNTPTVVALIARRGVIVLAEAVGQRGPGLEPVAVDSVFNIMSVTKPITATLVMMLAEDGLLGINREVTDYLPELAAGDNARVLVHHLLTHTSGFDDDVTSELIGKRLSAGELTPPPAGVNGLEHLLLSTTWDAPRTKDVGRQMIYANHNYTLLGEIVRRVSGQSLDAFARARLFEPLGMHSTGYVLDDHQRERLVHRAPDVPLGSPDPASLNPGCEGPEWETFDNGMGGVKASAPDLAIFTQMFLNGGAYDGARVLSRAAVAAMTRNQIPGVPTDFAGVWHAEGGYGYGWLVDTAERWAYFQSSLRPLGTLSHPGAGGANLFFDPANDIVGVVLEIASVLSEDVEPLLGVFERFENVIYSAIED
jgi:CubicO group peptidase (beta-lactamase class C family)